MRRLSDPAVRATMLASAAASPLSFTRLAKFENYVIGDTFHPDNLRFTGKRVVDIARSLDQDPFQCVADIVVRDRLRTVLWPQPTNDTDDDWELRRRVWEHPDVLLGGSDAGAHIDRSIGAPYTTRFLADVLRGRKLVSLERAVALMTDAPARLFGLRDRGVIAEGAHADLVLFDPDTVDAAAPTLAQDLPGGGPRLVSDAIGVESVFVNGVSILHGGVPTGARPGRVLRSGRDTKTVETR